MTSLEFFLLLIFPQQFLCGQLGFIYNKVGYKIILAEERIAVNYIALTGVRIDK